MKNPDFLNVAKRIMEERYPDADAAFVAGSIVRGEATEKSDIDLIVMYKDPACSKTGRDSFHAEGWPVEGLINTVPTQEYFINTEIKEGFCPTLNMILEGVCVWGDEEFISQRKKRAQTLYDHGPPKLDKAAIDAHRYALTDLLEDISEHRDKAELYGLLCRMHQDLGDFILRSHGNWSGQGKGLVRLLKKYVPIFSRNSKTHLRKRSNIRT